MRSLGLFIITVCLFAQPALAQLELIGPAGSGAAIANGDFQDLTPFAFGGGTGSVDFTVANPNTNATAANAPASGVFDDADLEALVANSTPVLQATVDNAGTVGAVLAIPGFTIARSTVTGGGSGVWGFDNNTGVPIIANTPLADPPGEGPTDNIGAFTNNGGVTLTSNAITLPGSVGATTTFTLSYDFGVDDSGGDDAIFFSPSLTIGGVTLTPGVPAFAQIPDLNNPGTFFAGDPNDPNLTFDATAGTIRYSGADEQLRATHTFTVDSDILADEVVLAIEILEDFSASTGEVDRGVVDNIVLTSEFVAGPDLDLGDFNDDGAVDILDYVVFRDNVGGPDEVAINNAGVDDGVIDALDHAVFVANFEPEVVAAAAAARVIPEPAAGLLVLAGVATGLAVRRR